MRREQKVLLSIMALEEEGFLRHSWPWRGGVRHKLPVSPPGEWASRARSSPLEIVTRGEGGTGKAAGKREQGRGNCLIPPAVAGQGSPSQHWGLREGPGGQLSMEMGQSSAG